MDYGKEKFGGPFTEEEVEDVKTVIRLLPLVICLSFSVSVLSMNLVFLLPYNKISNTFKVLDIGLQTWLFPVLLIPFYQLLVRPCIQSFCRPCVRSCSPSMLKCFGISVFVYAVSFLLLKATQVYEIVVSKNTPRYLSCAATGITSSPSDNILNAVFEGNGTMEQGFHETVWQSTVVIKCTEHSSTGIAFVKSSNITFRNITITNCGADMTRLFLANSNWFCNNVSLGYFYVGNAVIDHVSVQNGTGSGLLVLMNRFDLIISNSSFVQKIFNSLWMSFNILTEILYCGHCS